jgi:hypothetical protein
MNQIAQGQMRSEPGFQALPGHVLAIDVPGDWLAWFSAATIAHARVTPEGEAH